MRCHRAPWHACLARAGRVSSLAWGLAGCQDGIGNQGEGTTSATATDDAATGSTATTSSESSGDSTSTTIDGTDTGSTTGVASECGNGIREIGEQCDGLEVAGVPCPETCSFPAMTVLWEVQFDVEAASRDRVEAVAGAPDGRVIAGGNVDSSEAWLAAISPTGEVEWIERPEADVVNSIVVLDADAYIVGGTRDTAMWISRYDGSGAVVWQDTVEGPAEFGHYYPGTVTLLADGRIALVGSAELGGTEPGYLALYDVDGVLEELQTFAAPIFDRPSMTGDFTIFGTAIGNDVVISGHALLPMIGNAPWLQKRGLDGVVYFERSLMSPTGGNADRFVQAAAAADGGFSVAGGYGSVATDPRDIWIGSYSPEGDLRWEDVYVGEYGRQDLAAGVAVDSLGRTFMLGTVSDDDHAEQSERNYDMVLLSHAADGERRWEEVYSGDGMGGGAYSFDYAGAIAVDGVGFVLAAGYTMTPDTDYDVLVRLIAP